MAKGIKYGGQVGLSGESERLVIKEINRLMVFVRPFLMWPVMIIFMFTIAAIWPANLAVISFLAIAGIALAGVTLYHTHDRKRLAGRWHGAATAILMTGVLCYTDWAGYTHATLFIAMVAIPMFCLSWAIRAAIRKDDSGFNASMAEIFEKSGTGDAKMKALSSSRIGGKLRSMSVEIFLPRAEKTPDDLQKKTKLIEGGLGIPPGSLTTVQDDDDAAVANWTLSDPRILRNPIWWIGASMPGASISAPLHVGTWQDGVPVNWALPEQHVQIMGMTGSGKSLGAGWSTLAELITRKDVAIFAADITKGNQTLGPFRNSLNRLETTKEGARKMLLDVAAVVKPRTDYLASQGLAKWVEGCGLSYLVVWLEECPDIVDSLGDAGEARFVSSLKAARSAGITFVLSLQRSDWTQLPTIARGQLSKWCFGVAESTDASFGLSELQLERNAQPELWGMRHPGMAYLDAPGIPEERIAMPMRTWYWGNTDAKLKAHTDKYPVTFRNPLDRTTIDAMESYGANVADTSGGEEQADEPDFDYSQADRPLEPASDELSGWKFRADPTADPATTDMPEDAREALRAFVKNSKLATINIADLGDFSKSSGRKRQWLYWAMDQMPDLVERDEDANVVTWRVLGRDESHNLERARTFIASGKDRAQEYGSPVDERMKPEDLVPLYETGECYLCGIAIGAKRQIDHKQPLSKGGAHALSNLGATCVFCNESKGDMTEAEYREKMDSV